MKKNGNSFTLTRVKGRLRPILRLYEQSPMYSVPVSFAFRSGRVFRLIYCRSERNQTDHGTVPCSRQRAGTEPDLWKTIAPLIR